MNDHPGLALASFAAGLRYDAIPDEIAARAVASSAPSGTRCAHWIAHRPASGQH